MKQCSCKLNYFKLSTTEPKRGKYVVGFGRTQLQKLGTDHTILLVLPSGIYHYKFIVDGESRYITDLPCITDDDGRVLNLLDVTVRNKILTFACVIFLSDKSNIILYDHSVRSVGDL
jgi:Glycogen recognition site of AMP-activated protein kinase